MDSLLVSLSAGQAYPSQHPSLAWPLNPYVASTIKKIIYTQSLKGFLPQEDTEDTETPEVSFNGGGA